MNSKLSIHFPFSRLTCPVAMNVVFLFFSKPFDCFLSCKHNRKSVSHENCSEMDMCGIKCRVNFIEFNIQCGVYKTVLLLSFNVYMLIVFAVFVTAAFIILFVRFSVSAYVCSIPMVRFITVDDACREKKEKKMLSVRPMKLIHPW